jgi:hypothetical protein
VLESRLEALELRNNHSMDIKVEKSLGDNIGFENKRPRGEIGSLKAVSLSKIEPANRCYLYMDHEESSYIGCLLVDDFAFCRHTAKVLRFCCNRPIAQIGNLDLTYTL